MMDKYPNISPYNYCIWNPVKMIEPDGRDAEVVIDTDKKNININARIVLYAASRNISGKDVSRAQAMYKNIIMNSWGNDKNGKAWTVQHNGETYNVKFNVDVTVDNEAYYKNKRNYDGKTILVWGKLRGVKYRTAIVGLGTFQPTQGILRLMNSAIF